MANSEYMSDSNVRLIGASLSEPHINGTAVREFYILLWYVGHAKYMPRTLWLYGHKPEVFLCAFSCLGYWPLYFNEL